MSKLKDLYEKTSGGNPLRKGDLSRLFGAIISEINLDDKQIRMLMAKWVDDPKNRVLKDPSSRSSARGNIRKDIRREEITWKVFTKLIRWLRPVRGRLIIELDWSTGETTRHQITMDGEELPIENLGTIPTDTSSNKKDILTLGDVDSSLIARQRERLRRASQFGASVIDHVSSVIERMTDDD